MVEFELLLEELQQYAGLTHAGVPDDDVFEEEGIPTHKKYNRKHQELRQS